MTEAEQERAKVVAAEIRKTQIEAINQADESGCWPIILTILSLSCVQAEFGSFAANWFGLGAIIAIVISLWESGRNVKIRQRATEQWAAAFLARPEHLKGEGE